MSVVGAILRAPLHHVAKRGVGNFFFDARRKLLWRWTQLKAQVKINPSSICEEANDIKNKSILALDKKMLIFVS